jgi:mannose-6-phosphate isomerase-like protein (cupin superfamily)
VRVLLDHQHLRALVGRLSGAGDVRRELRRAADLLEEHVRREERELFPVIERLASSELDRGLPPAITGGGPTWGVESEELNATVLAWSPGRGVAEHVNDERDVLVCVLDGSATVTVDGEGHALAAGDALIVAKGARRAILAGPGGVRYLSAHRRRPRLQVGSAARDPR